MKNSPAFPNLNYLTEVEGSEALAFARKNNAYSDSRLKTDPRYAKTQAEILHILSDKNKLPAFFIHNGEIYNFWQDDVNIRGILRKTSVHSLNSGHPSWTSILDVDQLAKSENENWVYKGLKCLEPAGELCLVHLSRGGKDAVVTREFNLKTGKFVVGGFEIPESKNQSAWVDENTLMVGDATETSSLTSSGYPSRIKVLKRGQKLSEVPAVFSCEKECMAAEAYTIYHENRLYVFITLQISFYESEIYLFDPENSKISRIPVPRTGNFEGFFKDQALFSTREKMAGAPAGSLLSFPLKDLTSEKPAIRKVFTPNELSFYENTYVSKNHIWVNILNDVKKQVLKFSLELEKGWSFEPVQLGDANGNLNVSQTHPESAHVYFTYSDFLTPSRIYHLDENLKKPAQMVLHSPAYFKSENFKIAQYKAKSLDGTSVPYFVVYPKNLKLNSRNPTLLYGYGGFEIPMVSGYLGATGKAWLEKGGIYVLANIRGGGEYGPDWHRSVLREKRHKVYEDFYAIAEDLFRRQITSPRHLGIRGGSNGGLLTSVAFTQRPELFNAVISEVPLANMLEYHHWLAGASWMEEYGDPDQAEMRKYLLGYSPLHNLAKGKNYPEVFFLTSTKDDRVHPAHARQMVARLQELGYPVLYNENTDGGHGRAANVKDWAEFLALEFTYLYQKLF